MAPKKKQGTTMNLHDFAADIFAAKALPTASEGLEQEKGGKKGDRKGFGRGGDRDGGGFGGRDGDSADTGQWRGGGGDFGRGGDRDGKGKGFGRGGDRDRDGGGFGRGGDRDRDSGFGGRGGGRRDDDEPSRADTGNWFDKEKIPGGDRGGGFDRRDREDRGDKGGLGRDRAASNIDGVDDWRVGSRATPGGPGGDDGFRSAGAGSRPKLNLKPRTVDTPSDDRTGGGKKAGGDPFGSAKPVDIDAKMRERGESNFSAGAGSNQGSKLERNVSDVSAGRDGGDNWRSSGGAGSRAGPTKSGGSSWRDRESENASRGGSENKFMARSRKGEGKGERDGKGKGAQSKESDDRDRDFGALRRGGNTSSKDSQTKEDVNVVEEEGADGWNIVSMAGNKQKKGTNRQLEQVKEETSPNKKAAVNRFQAMPDSDEEEKQSSKKPVEESDEDESSDDEESVSKAGESASVSISREQDRSKSEDIEPLTTKTTSQISNPFGAAGAASAKDSAGKPAVKYVSPAVAKRQKEEEEKQARIKAMRDEREKKAAEERAIYEEKAAAQKKIDDAKAEVENQKNERAQQGMEDAMEIQRAALEAKRIAQEAAARKKANAAFMNTRFTKAFSNELVKPMDELLLKQYGTDGSGLVVGDYDVKKWFGAESEKNIYFAILLVVRRILHNATTEANLVKGLKNSTPLLKKLLADGGLESTPEEVLYAACQVVANEMRHPGTKQLPDYSADSGVIECFFYECYHSKFLSEEQILNWFDDVDDETNGRMDVTFQLSPFLQFLRPADEESDEDEDGSEEEDEDLDKAANVGVKTAKTRF